ncbi:MULTISPECIES: hypothetical protein [unclassified Mesorhizobium]|uniref:hypothetical protein n=1 Tax=unclassified Mesorhizobium TaxID=325217 RepID=UPI001FDF4FF2|nr:MULTISPECIES: hypothetical protein [unclassified Mesorhizobium]
MTADALLSPAAESGLVFGLGLIFSLGPQNLTLIQAGLTRSHPFTVGDPQQTLGTSGTRYYQTLYGSAAHAWARTSFEQS